MAELPNSCSDTDHSSIRDEPEATRHSRANQLLDVALERYRRPDGFEGDLVEAAWQLEQLGRDAWPVLLRAMQLGTPECEFFLGVVVRLGGIASQERLSALLAAARNPDSNVRSRLLELLDELPRELRLPVLEVLRAETCPDDVTDRAREAWEALVS